MALTRYAPTPSGYLHAGNIRNFDMTAQVAADVGADIALRIDDADATRYRREYAADIFRVLVERELPWTIGPVDVTDFEENWSQGAKTEYYRADLRRLRASVPTYACACSRTVQVGPATGGCAGECRTRSLPLIPGETALRVIVPVGTTITVGDMDVDVASGMGDFVIWRRDDLPAYQLVSVVEDRDLGTTHIVRGEDLLVSSAAQVFLAPALGAANVLRATFVHHPLITDGRGRKLSKSQRAQEVP